MKLSALAPVFLLSLGTLTACGGSDSTEPTPTPKDTTAPVITLNGESPLTLSAGTPYAETGATATDNIDTSVDVVMSGAVDFEVVNSYSITYSATDAAGNQSSLIRTINVIDDVAPILILTDGAILAHNAGDVYVDPGATATDNVDEASSINITKEGEVNSSVIASYTVTYTATDAAGNATSEILTVHVQDLEPPVITLNGEVSITLSDSMAYTEESGTALDNVDDNIAVITNDEVPATPGTYTINYTATDQAGNKATAIRTVIVQEDIVPELFAFTAQIDVFLNTMIESEEIMISGINSAITVSIIGGEFSINDSDFTGDESSISVGQKIKVRVTSGAALDESKQVSLTIGSLTSEFDVTTRTAEPSGLFEGTGSVNSAVNNLTAVKGMISNEHFMLFDEDERVLYEGNILTYSGNDFTASVDVYKNGVNSQTVTATGSIVNQVSFNLTLTGENDDYGKGTISTSYNNAYEIAATQARFKSAGFLEGWIGPANTVHQGLNMALYDLAESNNLSGSGLDNSKMCDYVNGTKDIPNSNVNIFVLRFDAVYKGGDTCDHVGIDYKGYATIVDGGIRGLDGLLWFAVTNGVNSNFSILTYQ